MADHKPITLKTVLEKLNREERLTDEEETFYLKTFFKFSDEEVATYLAIAKNTDKDVLID